MRRHIYVIPPTGSAPSAPLLEIRQFRYGFLQPILDVSTARDPFNLPLTSTLLLNAIRKLLPLLNDLASCAFISTRGLRKLLHRTSSLRSSLRQQTIVNPTTLRRASVQA